MKGPLGAANWEAVPMVWGQSIMDQKTMDQRTMESSLGLEWRVVWALVLVLVLLLLLLLPWLQVIGKMAPE